LCTTHNALSVRTRERLGWPRGCSQAGEIHDDDELGSGRDRYVPALARIQGYRRGCRRVPEGCIPTARRTIAARDRPSSLWLAVLEQDSDVLGFRQSQGGPKSAPPFCSRNTLASGVPTCLFPPVGCGGAQDACFRRRQSSRPAAVRCRSQHLQPSHEQPRPLLASMHHDEGPLVAVLRLEQPSAVAAPAGKHRLLTALGARAKHERVAEHEPVSVGCWGSAQGGEPTRAAIDGGFKCRS